MALSFKKNRIIFLFLFTIAVSAGIQGLTLHRDCVGSPCARLNLAQGTDTEMRVGRTEVRVEIADTDAERMRGLSGRDALGENAGMFFVFERTGYYGFWMKDMRFPIDIVWIGEDMRVAGITENISPETFPEVFYPPAPAQFVLEVPAGFSRSKDIRIGSLLKIR